MGQYRTLAATILLILAAAAAHADAPDPAAPAMPPVVAVQPTLAGMVYAEIKGRTLYTYDRDTQAGKSACNDDCAKDWAPLSAAWIAKPVGDWSVVARGDGSRQWAYKGKPLYTYAADHKRGDMKGDGAAGQWHALVQSRKFLPPGVAIREIPYSNLGPALATIDGKTLYMTTQYKYNPQGTQRHDKLYGNPGPDGCTGDCIRLWSPLRAEADAKADDAKADDAKAYGDWSIVARGDGSKQWAYKGWPLYTYANDAKPGDASGEGIMAIESGITGRMWEVATLP